MRSSIDNDDDGDGWLGCLLRVSQTHKVIIASIALSIINKQHAILPESPTESLRFARKTILKHNVVSGR